MKLKSTVTLLLSTGMILFFPTLATSQLVQGNVANVGIPSPSANSLNLLSYGMNETFTAVSLYYARTNKCPPDSLFLKEPEFGVNVIQKIYNQGCNVVGQFSSKAPGPLKNQIIRILPKVSKSSNHTVVDFSFRATITTIGFVNNGTSTSFFLNPPVLYRWSPFLQNTAFGNVPMATLTKALNDSYETIMTQDAAVNATSSDTTSTSGPTSHSTITTV